MALFDPFTRVTNANAASLSGAKAYFYQSGGLVLQSVYTTSALSVAHANPVVADSGGLLAPIYLNDTLTYRVIIKDASDNTILDVDPVDTSGFTQTGTGATRRGITDKLKDWVSVKDFGALGDNSTNDTAAIQKAIDTGKAVYFPDGTYRMATAATVNTAGQTIYGVGKLSSDGSQPCLKLTAASCTVTGLTFTGEGTAAAGPGDTDGALVRLLADNCMVTGCTFDAYRHGVEARGCDRPTITNNRFINGLTDAADTNATAGTAIDYRTDDSVHSYHGLISGNLIYGGFGFGISVFAEDSTSAAGGFTDGGVSNGGIHGIVITNNTIADGFAYGIYLYRRGGSVNLNVDHAIIANNYVSGITGDTTVGGVKLYGTGIYIQGAEYCIVEGNRVRRCVQQTANATLTPAGIGITNTASGIIRNNVVTDIGTLGAPTAGGVGIWHKAANVTGTNFALGYGNNPEVSNVVIEGNYVENTRLENIASTDSMRVEIRNNTCRNSNNASSNILVSYSGGGQFATDYAYNMYPVIEGNHCYDSALYGIYCDTTIGHKVSNNRIELSTQDGIRINDASYGHITGNMFKNCPTNSSYFSLSILSNCSANQNITGNTFDGGAGAAHIQCRVPARIRGNVHNGAYQGTAPAIVITATVAATGVITTSSSLYSLAISENMKFTVASNVGGMVTATDYFIREIISDTTFTVSDTLGGLEKTLTDAGPVTVTATFAGPLPLRLISARGTDDTGWWRTDDLDTTPWIGYYHQIKLQNNGATSISNFDGVVTNEPFVVWSANANTTLDCTGTSLVSQGGGDLAMGTNKFYTLQKAGDSIYVAN